VARLAGLPVLAVLSAVAFAAAPAALASPTGPRVTIGVFGDSVVEAYTIPHFLRDGLIPQLRRDLARAGGFQAGGVGLIPVTPFRWHFSKYKISDIQALAPDAWLLDGFDSVGLDGPSGYGALAVSPGVTATAPIDARLIGVLFTKFPGSGVFTVTSGSQTYSIDARSSGPPTPAVQWLIAPPGATSVTVHGPRSGTLIWNGVIVRAPVSPGRIGIEVENLGHMGQILAAVSAPRILATLRDQRFDVSVFISAYLWELRAAGGNTGYAAGYARELLSRIRLTRGYGGLCLIADPSPLQVPGAVTAVFAAIDRRVARDQGCAYSGALTGLWRAATAVRTGMTVVDGIHPTARGYRLIAQTLVPALVRLVRERVRLRGAGQGPPGPRR